MIQRCALLATLKILSCYTLLERSSKHSSICQWFLRKPSHPHWCQWWEIPPSQYVHRRNRPDLSVPNCHSYSHKKAIHATECGIYSGYSLCTCHVSLSNACTRWHDSKRFIGTPVLGKCRTTPMNIISLAMSFTICHQWPRLSVDAILVLVLLQLVAGGARNTTQSAASFPRLNMNCMFSSSTGPD